MKVMRDAKMGEIVELMLWADEAGVPIQTRTTPTGIAARDLKRLETVQYIPNANTADILTFTLPEREKSTCTTTSSMLKD